MQRDIVELFHYALKVDGYVVLGTSESIEAGELFRIVDKKRAIYQKRNVPAPEPRLPVFPLTHRRLPGAPTGRNRARERVAYGPLHQRMVEQYAPPSALISGDDKVVHLSEHSGRYLLNAGGEPTLNILELVRKELQGELRTALRVARSRREAVDSRPVPVGFNGDSALVCLHVRPSLEPHQEGYALVIFEERKAIATSPPYGVEGAEPATATERGAGASRTQELEAELEQTRERLEAIIAEYDASQEEMRASQEEMQSTNEELRSTMEELETSKEELQSMNEELQTVNQENRHKVEELSQLSADLRNLLAATDIATLFLDRDQRILRFTPKVEELFNIRVADRGRPLADLTHRLGDVALMDDAARVLETLVPIEREVTDESGRWHLARVMPYRRADDRVEGIVITFVDITAMKQAEQRLTDSKVYAESIVETLHEPLLVLNPDLTVKSCNPAFYEVFQVRPEETVGQRVYDLGNGQWNIPALRELLEGVLPTNDVFNDFEVRHRFEDLGERVMLVNARRLDHVQLILLGIRDVTVQHRASEFLRLTVEGLPIACVAADSAGEVALINSRTEQKFGYSRDELLGRAVEALVPERLRERFARDRAQCMASPDTPLIGRGRDLYGLRKDGSEFPVEVSCSPVTTSQGVYVLVAFVDITQRKEAERTLQEADRSKNEFLATLAHELRNPLAPIRLGLELMKSATGDAKALEEIRVMLERQTDQLVRLIDDLLDVSRITHGKLELRKRRTRLGDIVRQAVEASRPAIDEAGHDLTVSVPEQAVMMDADPHRLTQVVSNLLSNAARYTPSGGRIWLTAEQQGSNAVISVGDTGVGIPPEMREQVFDMFAQVRGDQENPGLGIGLTLVKTLVELHGGHVQVESAGENQGTTVTVSCPARPEGELQDAAPDTPESADLSGIRILVVDDSRVAADLLNSVLRNMGGDTRVAYGGQEAIETAAEFRPDAILIDLAMPHMNGYETARLIRHEPWGRHVTLIAHTGYGGEVARQRAKDAGFDHHLVKPTKASALRQVLEDAMTKPG